MTVDRPEGGNATGEQMHGELARVGADVPAGPETSVAVVTGTGTAFSGSRDACEMLGFPRARRRGRRRGPCARSGHHASPPRSTTTPDPQPACRAFVRVTRPPATVPDGGPELLTSRRPI